MAITKVSPNAADQLTAFADSSTFTLSHSNLQADDVVFVLIHRRRDAGTGTNANPLTITTGNTNRQSLNTAYRQMISSSSTWHHEYHNTNANSECTAGAYRFVLTADDLSNGRLSISIDMTTRLRTGIGMVAFRGVDTGTYWSTTTSDANEILTNNFDTTADDCIEFQTPNVTAINNFWNSSTGNLDVPHTVLSFGAFGRTSFTANSGTTGWTEGFSLAEGDAFTQSGSNNSLLCLYRSFSTFSNGNMNNLTVCQPSGEKNQRSWSFWQVLREAQTVTTVPVSASDSVGTISGQVGVSSSASTSSPSAQDSVGVIAGQVSVETVGTSDVGAQASLGTIAGQVAVQAIGTSDVAVQDSVGTVSGQVGVGSSASTSTPSAQDSIGAIAGQVAVGTFGVSDVSVQDSIGAIDGQVSVGSVGTSDVSVQDSIGAIAGQVSVSAVGTSDVSVSDSIGAIAGQVGVGSSATTSTPSAQDSVGAISGQVSVSTTSVSEISTSDSIGAISGQVGVGSSATTASPSAQDSIGSIAGSVSVVPSTGTATVSSSDAIGSISGSVAVGQFSTSIVSGSDTAGTIGGSVSVTGSTTTVTVPGLSDSIGAIAGQVSINSSANTSTVSVQSSIGAISGTLNLSGITLISLSPSDSVGLIDGQVAVTRTPASTSTVSVSESVGAISGQAAVLTTAPGTSNVSVSDSVGGLTAQISVTESTPTTSASAQDSAGSIGGAVLIDTISTVPVSVSDSVGALVAQIGVTESTPTTSASASDSVGAIGGAVLIGSATNVPVSVSDSVGALVAQVAVTESTPTTSASMSDSIGGLTAQIGVTESTPTTSASPSGSIGTIGGAVLVGGSSIVTVSVSDSVGGLTAQISVTESTPTTSATASDSVGALAAQVAIDALATSIVSGSDTVGVIGGSVSVVPSTGTATVSVSDSVGTVGGSVTIGSTPSVGVSASGSAGSISGSVGVGTFTEIPLNPPQVSIGTVGGTVDVDVTTFLRSIDIDGFGDIADTLVRTSFLTLAESIGSISGTASPGTSSVIDIEESGNIGVVTGNATLNNREFVPLGAIIFDGLGSKFLNLLSRSEIMSVEEVWNTGLTQLGVGRVDSYQNDTSSQASLIRAVWPNFRKQFISDHAWNGCKTTAVLTALPDSDFKDTSRWANIFSLPSDYIRALTVNGHRNQPDNSESVMWEIEAVANTSGVKSRCLCTNQSTARLEYVFDVGDANLDLLAPAMKHAMGLALAAFIAPNFGKSANEIALLEQKVREALLKARGIDGQENSARFFSPSELVESRYRSL